MTDNSRNVSTNWRRGIAKMNWAVWGLLCAMSLASMVQRTTAADWPNSGHYNYNTRNASSEHTLAPSNVGELKQLWVLTADGNVTATPAVVGGVVYFPDFGGSLWAVNGMTGKVLWKKPISRYSGIKGDVSRITPAYWQGSLITGEGTQTVSTLRGAYVFALNAKSSRRLWLTKVEADPVAIITSSPVVDDGVVYVGTSSKAETLNRPVTYRGSVLALNVKTGKIIWQTYLAPPGYTGAAVWGSTPVVDRATGLLYVATGNNYSAPPGVCTAPGRADCAATASDDYIDSVVALDLKTGRVVWAARTLTADISTNYNHGDGPDYDFGQGPILFSAEVDGKPTKLLGVGQKSGIYWALNPATGAVVWKTQVGPGSRQGGMLWGSATDGSRIYVSIGNGEHVPVTLVAPSGTQPTTTGGLWAALDASTGKILWQTADPQGTLDLGALTVANGVVYAGSMAATGENMYALDASTGTKKWAFASGGSVEAGAAVVDGVLYWGSGYKITAVNGSNNKFYAFGLPQK